MLTAMQYQELWYSYFLFYVDSTKQWAEYAFARQMHVQFCLSVQYCITGSYSKAMLS